MCWKEKIQWQSVANGLRKEHVLRPSFFGQGQCGKRPLAIGEWKFRVASKIHFILAGLASNSCKASRNMKTLATITGYSFKIS